MCKCGGNCYPYNGYTRCIQCFKVQRKEELTLNSSKGIEDL